MTMAMAVRPFTFFPSCFHWKYLTAIDEHWKDPKDDLGFLDSVHLDEYNPPGRIGGIK